MVFNVIKDFEMEVQLNWLASDASSICNALEAVRVEYKRDDDLEHQLRTIVLALDSLSNTLSKCAEKAEGANHDRQRSY